MAMKLRLGVVLLAASMLLGCSSSAASPTAQTASDSVTSSQPPSSGTGDLPVDTSLKPVSRSRPAADAKAAVEACWPLDDPNIGGAALIRSANEAGRYAPFVGTEPELQSDDPIWLVQYRGEYELRGVVMIDPTCAVVEGTPVLFLTHGARQGDKVVEAPPPKSPPSMALPPLDP